jgi:DNA-binding transcriptional ArsR family regulator
MMAPDPLSATFAALSDSTRRAILARLASGGASVTELAEPFAMSMPAISKHLKVLERAGLIARGREAQWRPCRLKPAPLKDVADWVEHYRCFWEQSFDRLDDYLLELKAREAGTRQAKTKEKKHGRKQRER